jgi:class 3 adenylate cyclase
MRDLVRQRLPPLDVRIGVHKGTVVAGVVGSRENLEYTVIGDVVNTAARFENLTRKHGVDILISADVRPALDGRFQVRELPPGYPQTAAAAKVLVFHDSTNGPAGSQAWRNRR